MSTRNHSSVAEWMKHISNQPGSGLSQADYCQRHGLSLHSFRARKYRQPSRATRTTSESASSTVDESWVELPLKLGGSCSSWQIELDLGNGICLRLRQG